MTRLRGLAPVVLLVLALAPPARGADPVSIEGTIVNGTQGGAVPPALTVTAVQLDAEGKEAARLQGPAPSGSFRIDGFDSSRGTKYVVAAEYLGVTYSTLAEGPGPLLTAPLRIFETTDDDAVVSIPADALTVVTGGEDRLEVLQLFKVRNGSDRTYVGRASADPRAVLRLPVPPGAFDVLPAEGITPRTITPAAEGFAIADPLVPGDTSVSYLYKVKAPRGGWILDRAVFYPTERFDLLSGPGVRVTGTSLQLEENVRLAGRPYRRYQAGPFQAGARIAADINGAEEPTRVYWWGLLAAGLLLAAGAGFATLRRRKRPEPPPSAAAERAALIEEIAALDDAHWAGKVAREEYEETRARLKERLVAVDAELAEQEEGSSAAETSPASAAPAVSGTASPGEPSPPGSS